MMIRLFKEIIKISIFLFVLVIIVNGVLGYDNLNTHPLLTEAAIDVYNQQTKKILIQEQIDWIIEGSIEEDNNPRYLNHYYNPFTGKGLDDIDEAFGHQTGVSAKEWAKNQSSWVSFSGDYSETAILRNYKEGNYERAYQGIGHILHLIQDMSVPAHTRNDSHSVGDPYENWAKVNGYIDLRSTNFIGISSLDKAFDELANFSHENFFSEDTIDQYFLNNIKDIRVEKDATDEYSEYIYNKNYKLIKVKKGIDGNEYSFDFYTHSDYWNILYPKAVGYSAGMLDYFLKQFDQIDEEVSQRKQLNFWDKAVNVLSNKDDFKYFVGDVLFSVAGRIDTKPFVMTVKTVRDIGVKVDETIKNTVDKVENIFTAKPADQLSTAANIGQVVEGSSLSVVNNQDIDNKNLSTSQQDESVDQEVKQDSLSVMPKAKEKIEKINEKNNSNLVIHDPYQWPISAEVIHEPYQWDLDISSKQQKQPSFVFVAGSNVVESEKNDKSQQLISENNETTTSIDETQKSDDVVASTEVKDVGQSDNAQDSNIQITDDSSQAEQFSADQNSNNDIQNNEDNQSQAEPAQALSPDIKFFLTNYDVRKSDFTLNWKDENNVLKDWELQYQLAPNFNWQDLNFEPNIASPDEGSVNFIAEYDDLTYYFRLRGIDADSNSTDWQYLQADMSTKPVVINEIAWMGTQASVSDEWIELANKTDQEIDLSEWKLKTSDGAINAILNGKISPHEFYLLERTNDDTVKTIKADQIYTGALVDGGQTLSLYDKDGLEMDSVYTISAGDKTSRKSSERISIWSSGVEIKNWKTYIGSGNEAQDAKGNKILGTPKAKNSQANLYYYLSNNSAINKDAIFLQNRGPYVADNLINISQSGVLNIEPGTVLKFGYLGGLDVYGKLVGKGTAENKIVFTSVDDDEYGGDTNNDGQGKIINWRKIVLNAGSDGEINNALFRYAGNIWTTDNEVFYIDQANIKISNTVFENMDKDILHFENSDIDVLGSEFRNNGKNAIYANGAQGIISNSIFTANKDIGVYISNPNGKIDIIGNNFIENKAPIRLDNFGDFNIGSNQVENNKYNGILIYAPSLDDGNTTLSADMPFVIMGFPVIQSSATLEIAPGTVIKFDISDFHGMTINGTLKAVGTQEKPIIFTSLYDDEYGGDTNNDSSATMPRPGLWAWLDFVGSENSVLDNAIIKYSSASRQSMGGPMVGGSAVYVDESSKNFILRNSQISDNSNGVIIYGDRTAIDNSSFSSNSDTGLSVFADNVTVHNATFNNNQKAIQSDPATMANILLSDLIFNGNDKDFWPENLVNPLSP